MPGNALPLSFFVWPNEQLNRHHNGQNAPPAWYFHLDPGRETAIFPGSRLLARLFRTGARDRGVTVVCCLGRPVAWQSGTGARFASLWVRAILGLYIALYQSY